MTVSIDRHPCDDRVVEPRSWTTARARVAGLRRQGRTPDDPAVLEAQRDLRAARLADHAARIAGQLTDEQRAHIRDLLDAAAGNAA